MTIVAPCIAIFSCILISSLRWAPAFGTRYPGFSPRLALLIVGCLAFLAGGVWFRRRFIGIRSRMSDCGAFDTDDDRRIIVCQKIAILSICGLVIPLLAVALTFWVF